MLRRAEHKGIRAEASDKERGSRCLPKHIDYGDVAENDADGADNEEEATADENEDDDATRE